MRGEPMYYDRSARWRWACVWAFASVWMAGPAMAQGANPEVLKAEVIYRSLMFVTWPMDRENSERGLQICTLGDGRVERALQTLAGRPIRQLSIAVRRQSRTDQLAVCHVLYVPSPQPALRAALAELPVLVVSDAAGMLDQGAMINLQVEEGHIVFDVDLDGARRSGLTVSTKLLRLARFVRHQQGASP